MSASGSADSSVVFAGLTLVGVMLVTVAVTRWRRLAAIRHGMMLAGAIDARIQGLRCAVGTIEGRLVRYSIMEGSRGSKGCTLASTQLPTGAAQLELHLKPELPRDKALVERGHEVDLVVGDPAFDAAFVVEAAPAQTVRALLDVRTRSELLTLLPCEIHIAAGQVQFRKSGVWAAPWEVCEIARLVGGLAARMPALGMEQQQHQLHALHAQSDGYRGISARETASRVAESEGVIEIAHVRAVRRRRAKRNALFFVAACVVSLIAFFVLCDAVKSSARAHRP
jgi:hypothetical protein